MPRRFLAVGIFIIAGVTLFTLGIFLIGSRHEAFSHHVLLYTNFSDLDGVTKGSKVQVAGMDAGQVTKIDVPGSPNGQFRVQMKVDDQFNGLVRTDSVVTVDTEGVVGNTFLTIHPGSPGASIAPANSVLQSKAPITLSELLDHGLGVMNDADATMKQLGGKLNVALDGVNGAVGNANDLLVGLKEGRGTAGMLLRDDTVAAQIRGTLASVQSTTSNLNQASAQVKSMVVDVQQRQLPQKLDDTMSKISSASSQADATIGQLRQSLAQALGPDANGVTAAQNINETLSNINAATGNMAEDTEALKHNFFFKGFFNQRGYYNLASLSPQEYRRSKHSIDTVVVSLGDALFKYPIVIEGYSDLPEPADAMSSSYARAQLVRNYLEARYPFVAKNVGVMPLSATPPLGINHEHSSGVCILIAEKL